MVYDILKRIRAFNLRYSTFVKLRCINSQFSQKYVVVTIGSRVRSPAMKKNAEFSEWVKRPVLFLAVSGPRFMKFWDGVASFSLVYIYIR